MKYEPRLHIVLHQPEIPQNTGNIGRTCVAVGAKLWLVRPLGYSLDDRYLARSGLDYWQHLEWEAIDSWPRSTQAIGSEKAQQWFFTKKAERIYTEASFQVGDVFVFGCETKGLPPSMIEHAGQNALRLPLRAEVRSLNLGSCVAAVAYEALRQFGPLPPEHSS